MYLASQLPLFRLLSLPTIHVVPFLFLRLSLSTSMSPLSQFMIASGGKITTPRDIFIITGRVQMILGNGPGKLERRDSSGSLLELFTRLEAPYYI